MTLTQPTALRLTLPLDVIARLCRRYGVVRLEVFGSAVRPDFNTNSDVDFLVEYKDRDAGPWMGKYALLQEGLSALLGRRVDVVSRRGIEQSRNPIRRDAILSSAELIYAE